jgi:hypothetical protein
MKYLAMTTSHLVLIQECFINFNNRTIHRRGFNCSASRIKIVRREDPNNLIR